MDRQNYTNGSTSEADFSARMRDAYLKNRNLFNIALVATGVAFLVLAALASIEWKICYIYNSNWCTLFIGVFTGAASALFVGVLLSILQEWQIEAQNNGSFLNPANLSGDDTETAKLVKKRVVPLLQFLTAKYRGEPVILDPDDLHDQQIYIINTSRERAQILSSGYSMDSRKSQEQALEFKEAVVDAIGRGVHISLYQIKDGMSIAWIHTMAQILKDTNQYQSYLRLYLIDQDTFGPALSVIVSDNPVEPHDTEESGAFYLSCAPSKKAHLRRQEDSYPFSKEQKSIGIVSRASDLPAYRVSEFLRSQSNQEGLQIQTHRNLINYYNTEVSDRSKKIYDLLQQKIKDKNGLIDPSYFQFNEVSVRRIAYESHIYDLHLIQECMIRCIADNDGAELIVLHNEIINYTEDGDSSRGLNSILLCRIQGCGIEFISVKKPDSETRSTARLTNTTGSEVVGVLYYINSGNFDKLNKQMGEKFGVIMKERDVTVDLHLGQTMNLSGVKYMDGPNDDFHLEDPSQSSSLRDIADGLRSWILDDAEHTKYVERLLNSSKPST